MTYEFCSLPKSCRIIGMGMFHATLVRFLGIVRLVACRAVSLLALELQSSRNAVAQPAAWTFIAEENESAMVKWELPTQQRREIPATYAQHFIYLTSITDLELAERRTERKPNQPRATDQSCGCREGSGSGEKGWFSGFVSSGFPGSFPVCYE